MNNIEAWPELIFKFGPYAILVIFVFWVAPRASKRMQNISKTAPKVVRVSATATLIASWTVVLVMVAYVLFQWSPVRVYDGELGVLKQSERIYPLDNNIYVKVEGTQAPNREKWHFVLVDRERALEESDFAEFTYHWGQQDNQYTDYSIPVSVIISGKVKVFHFTQQDAEVAYVWSEGQWKIASSNSLPEQVAFNWGWDVFANDSLQQIADKLASLNRVQRAKARSKMRKLSKKELQELLQMSNGQVAIRQIQLELDRRD